MTRERRKVPVIVGPTAVGKTAIALQIAERMGWEILSCDSRQIYRKMDIGTAKPDKNQLSMVPHWFIDIIDPSEAYSAYRFAEDAVKTIRERAEAGKTVLICGGTGLYFKSLSRGLDIQVESDPVIRDELMKRAELHGSMVLFEELLKNDPVSASRIHPNDLQRIVRALGVFYQTGIPLSENRNKVNLADDIDFEVIKIFADRELLYKRINDRVERMFKDGLWDEFRSLLAQGYHQKSPGMQCVGYQELFAVNDKRCSLPEAVELIQRNSRRYAKRQITWFSHQEDGTVFDTSNNCDEICSHFFNKL